MAPKCPGCLAGPCHHHHCQVLPTGVGHPGHRRTATGSHGPPFHAAARTMSPEGGTAPRVRHCAVPLSPGGSRLAAVHQEEDITSVFGQRPVRGRSKRTYLWTTKSIWRNLASAVNEPVVPPDNDQTEQRGPLLHRSTPDVAPTEIILIFLTNQCIDSARYCVNIVPKRTKVLLREWEETVTRTKCRCQ